MLGFVIVQYFEWDIEGSDAKVHEGNDGHWREL